MALESENFSQKCTEREYLDEPVLLRPRASTFHDSDELGEPHLDRFLEVGVVKESSRN